VREPGAGADGVALHVLIVVENIPFSIDHRVRKQLDALLARGDRVSVITRKDPANDAYRSRPRLSIIEYLAPAEPKGALGYVLEYGWSFICAALLTLRARLRGRIDVVQFCQPPDIYFPLAWLLRLAGARIVVDQRDLMPELYEARYDAPSSKVLSALSWLERRSQRVADHVLCVNGYLRERAVRSGSPAGAVTILRNGPVLVRVDEARPDPSLKAGRRFLACWVGKMGRQDRMDLLLGALDHLVHGLGRTDCHVAILGDGEQLEDARRTVEGLKLDPWVSFPGWMGEAEVFRYLATADLGLDASLQEEVSPVKAMEYMAFGIPFVAFDLGETRAIGEGAADLVAKGNVKALGSAIDSLLNDGPRREAMGAIGRARVRAELAWEPQAGDYLAAIDGRQEPSFRAPV
jgi:glycosyltransferase involved in cell wall biosynthesis